jgi:hypothetical protein
MRDILRANTDRHCALHSDWRDAKRDDLQREAAGTARIPAGFISDIFPLLETPVEARDVPARPIAEGCMGLVPETTQLLSRLPTHLATNLFASATRVKLAADQVLFLADDPGDSCYCVEDGLLKVTMVSRSGTERILSFISRGGIVGELAILDGLPRRVTLLDRCCSCRRGRRDGIGRFGSIDL